MAQFDRTMFEGEWRRVYASKESPFILPDAPVVTWTRNAQGLLSYGAGFGTENIEVIVPVAPSTCIHVLPKVPRSIDPIVPSIQEINAAQVAYATSACFSGRGSKEIDSIVQRDICTVVMGENIFTVWHMPHDNLVYDILMGQRPGGRRS